MRHPEIKISGTTPFFVLNSKHYLDREKLATLICHSYSTRDGQRLRVAPKSKGEVLSDCRGSLTERGASLYEKVYPAGMMNEALDIVDRLFPDLIKTNHKRQNDD